MEGTIDSEKEGEIIRGGKLINFEKKKGSRRKGAFYIPMRGRKNKHLEE